MRYSGEGRAAVARMSVMALALAMLVGCATAVPASPSTAASSDVPDTTSAYGQLFNAVGVDGSVSMNTALQAFALAIAPLPGVTAPTGDAPMYERMDGTFAIGWLMPYLDQLTPDQQAAVTAALTPASNAVEIQPSSSPLAADAVQIDTTDLPAARDIVLAADPTIEQYYVDNVTLAVPVIAAKLGRGLHWPIKVTVNNTQQEGAKTLAYTTPELTPGGSRMTGCDIFVNPLLLDQGDFPRVRTAMAHEAFHCFQFQLEFETGHTTFAEAKSPRFDWIIEGQAEWAGEDVAGATPDGADWWADYLDSPTRPLWMRTYDAMGFYQHLAEEGISPWSVFDAMLVTDSDVAAYQAANTANNQFLDTWASGMTRTTALPEAWNAQGPWTTRAHAKVTVQPIKNGDLVKASAAPVTNVDWALQSTADITELTFTGHARMFTDEVDTPEITDVDLCTNTTSTQCNCPAGLYFNGPPLQPSDGIVFLGMTGALDGTYGTIKGRPLSDFCQPTPPQKPAPRGGANPCANGCAGTIGDPHLQTVDQPDDFYEFQGAGEYTLLRSPDGSMEMQARQVPYSGDIQNVSINTALAWKVAGHRVGMYANPGSDTYTLTLDGSPVDQATVGTKDLGSGAALTVMADGIEVAYGDGTITTALFHGNGFADALDLQVAPSDTFRAQAVGLLGRIPVGSELPALPDGTVLPRSFDPTTRYTQRYKQLGPAWLVSDQTTLFDYQPGQTTASFYKPDYPSQDAPIDPDLDAMKLLQGAETFDQAAGQCAAVQADPNQYLDCVFDILLTGDGQFAQFYAFLGQFLAAGPTVLQTPIVQSSPTPAPSTSGALPPGFALVASGISLIDGATVGLDGTVYASLSDNVDYSPILASVNASTGQPGPIVHPSGAGQLFLLDGSLWMAEDDPTGSGNCLLERFDPQTLASQVKIPVGCDISGPEAAPVTDGVWWVDRSTSDANAKGGTLRHVDPATNTVDRSVPLPFVNGYLSSNASTVIYGDSAYGDGLYRLTQGASDFVPVPLPANGEPLMPFVAGDGLWYQPESELGLVEEADFVTTSSSPDKTIQIDGYLEAADEQAVYSTSGTGSPETLMRYPTDGSAPSVIMSGTSLTTTNGSDDLGFFDNNPLVIANGKIAKLWLASGYPVDGTTSVVTEVTSVP